MEYVFMTRPYLLEMSVPKAVVRKKYVEYFGIQKLKLRDKCDAIQFLSLITNKIQSKMVDFINIETLVVCSKITLYKAEAGQTWSEVLPCTAKKGRSH